MVHVLFHVLGTNNCPYIRALELICAPPLTARLFSHRPAVAVLAIRLVSFRDG